MPEYETLDCRTLPDKTEVGSVKHNRKMGREITGLATESLPYALQPKRPEATESAATMANDLLLQTESDSESAVPLMDGVELDLTFGVPVEQKPIWIDLYENLRDVFFPPKLPPLELTSTPIPVPDRMAVKRNPMAVSISTTLNGAFLVFLFLIGVKAVIDQKKPPVVITPIDLTDFKPPKAGGGGGSPDRVVVEKGKIPPPVVTPIVIPKLEPPLPAIDVIIPDTITLPNIGMSNSPNVKLGSLGNGSGTGIGSGNGSGYGPGSGGGTGGGLYRVGGAISQPIPLNSVEAEFSDEARRAKYQGVCLISVIVDAQGNPQNPRVVRALGMGLDEKAIEAVRKYKFKPALKDGKTPVPVMINVEINFRLY